MERDEMTARVLRALENPHLDVWGHPLARRLRKRDPVQVDLDRVLDAAARQGVAIELNCQPERLDLPEHLLRAARDRGLSFVISTDSHAVRDFEFLAFGVWQARRGWLRPEDVLNTRDFEGFQAGLR
jgi:DNA polymerase (family 10)